MTSSVPIARHAALLGGGFDLRVSPEVTFGLFYAGELARAAHDHSIKGDFAWRF